MNKEKLKIDYNNALNNYFYCFCEKHGYDYFPEDWTKSGMVEVADYFMSIETIIADINYDAPEDKFLEWYDYCLEAGTLGFTTPNYSSYLKGCPLVSEATIEKVKNLKEEFDRIIKENNEAEF